MYEITLPSKSLAETLIYSCLQAGKNIMSSQVKSVSAQYKKSQVCLKGLETMIFLLQKSLQCSVVIHPMQCLWADLQENNIRFINKNLEVVENIYPVMRFFEFLLVMKEMVKDLHIINQERAY